MKYPVKDTPVYLKAEDKTMTRVYAKIECEGDTLYLIRCQGYGGALPINEEEDKVHWVSPQVRDSNPVGFFKRHIWVPIYGYDGEHHNSIKSNEDALSLLESEELT